MTRMTGSVPYFHCNDVVLQLGSDEPYDDLVEELRRTAWRRYEEEQRTGSGGQLSSSGNPS